MRVYTPISIGQKTKRTPEGFLLCEDVPIARTGIQIYGDGEIDVPAGPDGLIRIMRDADEVFRPETLASFHAKPIVDDHPMGDVTPENWRDLARGVVLNPRRGKGTEDDVMFADFLVTDGDAIDAILNRGKREVSCGYDADYDTVEPGYGRQRNIVGNHVALVEHARCGARCSIQDSTATRDCCGDSKEEELPMRLAAVKQRLRDAFGITDEKKLNDILADAADGKENNSNGTEVHVHLTRDEKSKEEEEKEKEKEKENQTHDAIKSAVTDAIKPMKDSLDAIDMRLKKVEGKMVDADPDDEDDEEEETKDESLEFGAEAPPGTSDSVIKKTKDSALFEESFQETVAIAEIIVPGMKAPTFDAKADKANTVKDLCNFRRKVLDKAMEEDEVKEFVGGLIGNKSLKTCDCSGVRTVFNAVGAFARKANNSSATTSRDNNRNEIKGGVRSIAELNKLNTERYAAMK